MLFALLLFGLVLSAADFGPGSLGPTAVSGSSTPAPLAATLTLTPTSAVPNETVVLIGSGFTGANTADGAGPGGAHQITGAGFSVIKLGGTTISAPQVTYPINLDGAGGLTEAVVIPVDFTTMAGGSLILQVTDDQGVTASATLTMVQRKITLDKTTGGRQSDVRIEGIGFPATNLGASGSFTVTVDYDGTAVATITPNSDGEFETTFKVPRLAGIPSTNTVTALIAGTSGTATATHSVPAANNSVSPDASPPGSSVTVSGNGFPAFAQVSSITLGGVQVLQLPSSTTSPEGRFTKTFLVPEILPGSYVVVATVGGVTAAVVFQVSEALQSPTPTPTPAPSVSDPSTALEPLMAVDNLVRVWNFNNTTKNWTFFDPRPGLRAASTITELVSGDVYWLNVFFDQTLVLNNKQRTLTTGWNLLSW